MFNWLNGGYTEFELKLKLRLSNLALLAGKPGLIHALFSYLFGGWGQQLLLALVKLNNLDILIGLFCKFWILPNFRVVLHVW